MWWLASGGVTCSNRVRPKEEEASIWIRPRQMREKEGEGKLGWVGSYWWPRAAGWLWWELRSPTMEKERLVEREVGK